MRKASVAALFASATILAGCTPSVGDALGAERTAAHVVSWIVDGWAAGGLSVARIVMDASVPVRAQAQVGHGSFSPERAPSVAADDGGEAASQRSVGPRPLSNEVRTPKGGSAGASPAAGSPGGDLPALDEKEFTAALKAGLPSGQGGPFVTSVATSAPVVSKLVNGEPVVVMRIGPLLSAPLPPAPEERQVAAEPAWQPETTVEPASPQAIVSAVAPGSRPVSEELPREAAVFDPASTPANVKPAKPRGKPEPSPKKAAKPVKMPNPGELVADEPYQPPVRDAASSSAPDLADPGATPPPVATMQEGMTATSAPAPLVPVVQP